MTLPQSGRLDGGEQPQGLPDARAQRLFAATVFLLALDIKLLLVAEITAQVLFFILPPWRPQTLSPDRVRRCHGAGAPHTAAPRQARMPPCGFGHRILSKSTCFHHTKSAGQALRVSLVKPGAYLSASYGS